MAYRRVKITDENAKNSRNGGWKSGADGLQCLECGAILPGGVEKCPSCGNEKNLHGRTMVATGGDVSTKGSVAGQGMARDTRILVGLTLALFCALIFLGSARARREAMLKGISPENLTVVLADTGN